jgi:hypothetical protein
MTTVTHVPESVTYLLSLYTFGKGRDKGNVIRFGCDPSGTLAMTGPIS